jgi:actin-related protein 5
MLQKGGAEAEAKTKWWQLPWVPPPEKEQPSEEELARRAAIKEKQGQRLREMAFAKRSSKIADLETEIEGFEYLLQELDDAEDAKAEASLLGPSSFGSREEVQAALAKATMSLRKAKGEPVDIKKVEDDIPMSEKYPLLEVPNSLLTPEQLKEKKKQQFLKITTEGRIRAKQKRQEEDLQREREQQLEEERRL